MIRPRLLIVDDDPAIVSLLSDLFDPDRYEVFVAMNGLEGLKLALVSRPDLMILDIDLPAMDGNAVFARLREDPAAGNTPVFFLTARPELVSPSPEGSAGPDEYMTKPFDLGEFILRAKVLIDRRMASA